MLASVILFLLASCCLVTFGTATFVSITSRDIQLRCCNNQWKMCCKHYPSMGVSGDQEGSAFSDTEGSADYSGTLSTPSYCQKYGPGHHNNYIGEKCLNNYLLFRDMRATRNLIAELHRCSAKKDYEFINATLKIGQRMRPSGLRCCWKDQQESSTLGILYLKLIIFNDLDELEKKYYLQRRHPRIPCSQYGDTKAIEYRLSESLWRMGVYLTCAEGLAC